MKKFNMKNLKPETKLALITDENYPLEKAYKLVDNDDIYMIKQFITRADITSEYLSKYVNYENFNIRRMVASNSKLPIKDLEVLLDDIIEEVVVAAIANPSITIEMFDKLLSNIELLSYSILIACLKSRKVTDTQIKNIFNKYSVSVTNPEENDELVKLAIEAIRCENISEDTALDIINFMGGSAADDIILRTLVVFQPDFQKSIRRFCFDDNENFFYNNEHIIRYLSKENFEYIWYNFIKDVQKGVITDVKKGILCLYFAKSNNITDQFVIELISFAIEDEKYGSIRLENLIEALLENKELSKKSIEYLWKIYTAKYSKGCMLFNDVVLAFKEHPNAPKKLLDYLS